MKEREKSLYWIFKFGALANRPRRLEEKLIRTKFKVMQMLQNAASQEGLLNDCKVCYT